MGGNDLNKQEIIQLATDFVETAPENRVAQQIALSERVVGLKMFDAPLFGFASAADEFFSLLKDPAAIGPHFLLPQEWLPGARTVISFFLPFTDAVRKSNRRDLSWPSDEWLHGRIEGQIFLGQLCRYLKSKLTADGHNSLVPSLDERFWHNSTTAFTSNWSERHVAYVCGLGTFGLSKGLITKKGIAGRFGSIITELCLTPDSREYDGVYAYCSQCGRCAKNCPVQAISIEKGKNHAICSAFLDKTAAACKPRYGCGKCQVHVPCESSRPKLPKVKPTVDG